MKDPCDFANNIVNLTSEQLDYKIFGNCTLKFNSSDFGVLHDKKVENVFQVLFYTMASIGNFLLLFVMYKDPLKRFRNSTSYFIINLTLADLLSTASGITESIIQLNPRPRDPKFLDTQEDHKLAACFDSIGIQCSLLMVMIFSLDRYMAIVRAYTYKNIVALKPFVVLVILLPWCFAIITLPVMYFASLTDNVHELLTRMLAGNFIALPCVTLTVHPYTHWVFKRKVEALRKSVSNHKQLLEENLKIAKVLATTVLVVSICLIVFILPYFVAFLFHVAKCDKCFLNNTFLSFWGYYPLLSSIRVVINSVVYAWRLPLYRKSLKALLPMFGTGNRSLPGNRIHDFHIYVNGGMHSSTLSFNKTNNTINGNNETQSTTDVNDGTVKKSLPDGCVAQPIVLSNTGGNQASRS